MLSHFCRTSWRADKVVSTSRFQLSGLDVDPPALRGPFIALWTVGLPLYLAMTVRVSLQRCRVKASLQRHLVAGPVEEVVDPHAVMVTPTPDTILRAALTKRRLPRRRARRTSPRAQ